MPGIVKLFAIDSDAPTPTQLPACVAELSGSLEGGTEVPSPQDGPPFVPWTSNQEGQLRAKLAEADFPEIPNPNANCALKFHNKSSIPVLVTQVYPAGGKARTVKAGGEAGIGVGANLLDSRWRVEGYERPYLKAPEYTVSSNGAHNVFIVDLAQPTDVETFIEVSEPRPSVSPPRPAHGSRVRPARALSVLSEHRCNVLEKRRENHSTSQVGQRHQLAERDSHELGVKRRHRRSHPRPGRADRRRKCAAAAD